MNTKTKVGLIQAGKDEEGQTLYIGTKGQWHKAEELENHDCHAGADDGCTTCQKIFELRG